MDNGMSMGAMGMGTTSALANNSVIQKLNDDINKNLSKTSTATFSNGGA